MTEKLTMSVELNEVVEDSSIVLITWNLVVMKIGEEKKIMCNKSAKQL